MGNTPKTECCLSSSEKAVALPAKLNFPSLLDDFLKIVGDISPLPSVGDRAAVKSAVQRVAGDLVDLVYDQLNAPTPSVAPVAPTAMTRTELANVLVAKATAAKAVASVSSGAILAWIITNASTIISLIESIIHSFTPATTTN